MPSNALQTHIQGLREAKAAFQALPASMRTHLNAATATTVQEIARLAKAQVLASPSVRTRTLYNAIGSSMNTNNGRGRAGVSNITTTLRVGNRSIRVKGRIILGPSGNGVSGSQLIRPSRYAHFVEFGTVNMPAEPFMIPAAEAEKPFYLQRCQNAGKQVESDLAAIGGRTL